MKRAIVVGSGAGGAMAARELATAFDVTVLEAGPEFRPFDHHLVLGWVTTIAVNAIMAGSGTVLFLVTPRLAIGSLLFAVVLGVGSGFYPSLHAARLKPVMALRYE